MSELLGIRFRFLILRFRIDPIPIPDSILNVAIPILEF